MVSYHFAHPSTSSIQTDESTFEDARSHTSSLDGIPNLFDLATQNNLDDMNIEQDNDNFGAIPTPNHQTQQPSSESTTQPATQNTERPQETGDDRFNALLELLNQSITKGGSSQRAKASVDNSTPIFRGDQTDKIDCGRWIETFEREARYYELPRMDWPMAAAKRFPADSSAANWVDSMFGTGLNFEASWSIFRSDFLEHFTPPDALPVARANFDNLHLAPNGNITQFNKKFTDLATRLNCVLRDAGMPCLTFASVCLAYQTKLSGPVRIHVDQYLSQRNIFNVERQRDGRPIFEVTPKELLAAAQQFASQTVHASTAPTSQPIQQQAAQKTQDLQHGTIPMDIDTLIEEKFNALQRRGRFSASALGSVPGSRIGRGGLSGYGGGGGSSGTVQCWECGGWGHVRSRCGTFLARKEKEKSLSESGKGGAQ